MLSPSTLGTCSSNSLDLASSAVVLASVLGGAFHHLNLSLRIDIVMSGTSSCTQGTGSGVGVLMFCLGRPLERRNASTRSGTELSETRGRSQGYVRVGNDFGADILNVSINVKAVLHEWLNESG
jgi:hypothetical protein